MKQSSGSGRRMRGRPNRNKNYGAPNRNSNFESNGPDGRVRGNASQVYEKYLTLGREAVAAGDRVMAEAFYQHAEHYYRLMNDTTDPRAENTQRPPMQDMRREDGRRDESGRDDFRRDDNRRNRHNGAAGDGREQLHGRPGRDAAQPASPANRTVVEKSANQPTLDSGAA
ncbi:MAG: DUF4167 domain-containing protein, partial [Kiloniellales bacterium]|nr:DUF4167 domain-containing protein [Kiloniellales bacterium]